MSTKARQRSESMDASRRENDIHSNLHSSVYPMSLDGWKHVRKAPSNLSSILLRSTSMRHYPQSTAYSLRTILLGFSFLCSALATEVGLVLNLTSAGRVSIVWSCAVWKTFSLKRSPDGSERSVIHVFPLLSATVIVVLFTTTSSL